MVFAKCRQAFAISERVAVVWKEPGTSFAPGKGIWSDKRQRGEGIALSKEAKVGSRI